MLGLMQKVQKVVGIEDGQPAAFPVPPVKHSRHRSNPRLPCGLFDPVEGIALFSALDLYVNIREPDAIRTVAAALVLNAPACFGEPVLATEGGHLKLADLPFALTVHRFLILCMIHARPKAIH
jgi:hypothetical protein